MKTLFVLLSCLTSISSFSLHSMCYAQPLALLAGREPHLKEFDFFYKNGKLNQKVVVLYDNFGNEYKRITETYRKDGTKRERTITNELHLLEIAKYNKQEKMRFEPTYRYYHDGTLECIETLRANGKRHVWTEHPPTPQGFLIQYY